jgi:hypothetical protein
MLLVFTPSHRGWVVAGGNKGQQLQQQQRRPGAAQVQEDLRLVEIGVRCSLEQMLEEGFYHAGEFV